MHKRLLIISALGFGLLSSTGCFFKPKPKTSNNASAVEHKNHGQQRKEEVHDRNDARKAAKDAEKDKK